MISVIIYTAYQAIMEKIHANESFRTLGHKNPKDAKQISKEVAYLPLTHDPTTWGKTIHNMLR